MKNKKVVKKSILYGLIYIVIALVLFMFVFGKDKTNYKNYLIINNSDFYQYEDGQIKQIIFQDTDYQNHIFDIYSRENYSGEYLVQKNASNELSVYFQKNGSSSLYQPKVPYIALTKKMTNVDFSKEDLTELDLIEVKDYLYTKKVYNTENLFGSYKISIDLNNDNTNDTIYVITNVGTEENSYSLVYVDINGQKEVIEEYYYSPNDFINSVICNVTFILDLDNNKEYTIVVESSDMDSSITNFYKKSGLNYHNIKTN